MHRLSVLYRLPIADFRLSMPGSSSVQWLHLWRSLVRDQTPIWVGALAGAIAGELLRYLYFTPEGRRLRETFEARLGELMSERHRARVAADRAGAAAGEGWDSVRHLDSTLRGREPM
jgi:hypothetical protein